MNPPIGCQECRLCLTGRPHLCPRRLLSASLPGSNAEFVAVPASAVYPWPPGMPLELAALTEPTACAVRAVRQADPRPRQTVLVVGMGPLGLLMLQVLRVHGIERLVAVERNPHRLRYAEEMGVLAIVPSGDVAQQVRERLGEADVDIAIDAVGATATRRPCLECVSPGGRVVFFGLHEPESPVQVNAIVRREIECVGSFACAPEDFGPRCAGYTRGKCRCLGGRSRLPWRMGPCGSSACSRARTASSKCSCGHREGFPGPERGSVISEVIMFYRPHPVVVTQPLRVQARASRLRGEDLSDHCPHLLSRKFKRAAMGADGLAGLPAWALGFSSACTGRKPRRRRL